jgi:hypothetical protein
MLIIFFTPLHLLSFDRCLSEFKKVTKKFPFARRLWKKITKGRPRGPLIFITK